MQTKTRRRNWFRRRRSSPECVCWRLGSLALRLSVRLSPRSARR